MDSDTPSTARGLLMLMLRPIPTFFMEDLDTTDMLDSDISDMDTLDMPDSDTESMARGLLMLRLSLILLPRLRSWLRTWIRRTPRIWTPWICRTRIRRILPRQVDYIKIFQGTIG